MTTQNGTIQNAVQTPVATGDPISQALATLISQAGQTNQHLEKLTVEISAMNQQLFGGATRPWSPQQQPVAQPQQPGPVAQIVPDRPQQPWQKEIIQSRCSEVGISKVTTATGKWKLLFHMDGERYNAMALGWSKGEFKSLIQLVRVVLPEISEDHFSESNFSQRNAEHQAAGKDGNYEEILVAPEPFIVEWYTKTSQGNGKTYAYVERVYPITSPA